VEASPTGWNKCTKLNKKKKEEQQGLPQLNVTEQGT
jgi:hypothetical protein